MSSICIFRKFVVCCTTASTNFILVITLHNSPRLSTLFR